MTLTDGERGLLIFRRAIGDELRPTFADLGVADLPEREFGPDVAPMAQNYGLIAKYAGTTMTGQDVVAVVRNEGGDLYEVIVAQIPALVAADRTEIVVVYTAIGMSE